jgi:hypothetical protein
MVRYVKIKYEIIFLNCHCASQTPFPLTFGNPGNAYDGPDGEELLRTVQRQAKEAEVKATGMVLRAFGPRTSLEDLWVGDTRFEFVRDGSGLVIDFVRHEEERREGVLGMRMHNL